MLHALEEWKDRYTFSVEVIDVDAHEALVEQYDELVPMLLGVKQGKKPVEICHYFLDQDKVQAFLQD